MYKFKCGNINIYFDNIENYLQVDILFKIHIFKFLP